MHFIISSSCCSRFSSSNSSSSSTLILQILYLNNLLDVLAEFTFNQSIHFYHIWYIFPQYSISISISIFSALQYKLFMRFIVF